MATNPLIAMGGNVPTKSVFSNVLTNIESMDRIDQSRSEAPARQRLLEAQASTQEAVVPTDQEQFNAAEASKLSSVAAASRQIIPDLQAGNVESVVSKLEARKQRLEAAGIDASNTDKAIALAQTDPQELLRVSNDAVAAEKSLNPSKAAVQFGGQQTFKDEEGNLFFGTTARNPQTGGVDTVFSAISGQGGQPVGKVSTVSASGQTPEEKTIADREKSARDIQQAGSKKAIELKAQRTSGITKELSERNRGAARSQRTLRQALTLAKEASQGLPGAAKLQLSRLIPGIDASDEGALDATLKQLALEQLQLFKGPTTDFEFGVTQAIAGSLGQSRESNEARVKSLDRAMWFNKREFEQFQKHTKAGGDPDAFRFNFGEPIKTKKGSFTLQDIQDTAVQNTLTIEETIKRLNQ